MLTVHYDNGFSMPTRTIPQESVGYLATMFGPEGSYRKSGLWRLAIDWRQFSTTSTVDRGASCLSVERLGARTEAAESASFRSYESAIRRSVHSAGKTERSSYPQEGKQDVQYPEILTHHCPG